MEVIFRMAGILLIMGSTVWTGATLAAREKYRLRDLGELERGVLLLEGQIAYLSAPLPEVLESGGCRRRNLSAGSGTDGVPGWRFGRGNMGRRLESRAEGNLFPAGRYGRAPAFWENAGFFG